MATESTKELIAGLTAAKKEAAALLVVYNKLHKTIIKSGKDLKASFGGLDLKNADDIAKMNTMLMQATTLTKQQTTAKKESNAVSQQKVLIDKQLKSATDEQVKGKIRLANATKAQKQALQDEVILLDKSSGTLQKLNAENRKLRREREKLNLDTTKGTEALKKINTQLDINNKRIVENSDKMKKQRLNVGNYTDSTKEALHASGLFSGQLAILSRIQATLSAITKKNTAETAANAVATTGAKAATTGFSKSLRIMRIALISTGIGAIVVLLGGLIAAFSSTQRGADAFSKVLEPLKAIVGAFLGLFQDASFVAFQKLKDAFTDPAQAIKDLGQAILDNLINRFTSVMVFGEAITALLGGEWELAMKKGADAMIQLTTGVEDATDKMGEFGDEITDTVDKGLELGKAIDAMNKALRQLRLESTVPLAKLELEFQKQKAIINDLTVADEARLEASNKAVAVQLEMARIRKEELALELQLLQTSAEINDTDAEALQEIEDKKAEILRSDAAAAKKIAGLTSIQSGIEKRLLTERKEETLALGELTVKTAEETDAELFKIQTKGHKDRAEASKTSLEKNLDDETKIIDAKLKGRKEIYEKSIEQVEELVAKSFEKREEAINKDLAKTKEAQSKIKQGIENGNEDAKKSLAAEERREEELERKKEQERKKAQRAEAAIALLKVLGENADKPDALGKTLANYGAILAAIQSAPLFFEGTDNTGTVSNGLDSNGGRMAMIHNDEMIFSKADRNDVGNRTRSEIKDIVNSHERNLLNGSNMGFGLMGNESVLIALNGVKNSLDALPDKMPISDYQYNEVDKQHVQTTRFLNRVEKVRTKANKSWN